MQQRDRIRRHRLAVGRRLRQHRSDHRVPVVGTAGKAQRVGTARFEIHQHVDRLVDGLDIERLIIEIANGRIGEAGVLQLRLSRGKFARLDPRDPGGDHEISLEGVDRRPQRLQHVGFHHRRRAKKPRCDARQQLPLGQPVLHQTGMDVDRARQCNTVEGHLLLVNAIGRETGEQNPDERDETDDEAQPNHSLTRESNVGEYVEEASLVCRSRDELQQGGSQPRANMRANTPASMDERSSARN